VARKEGQGQSSSCHLPFWDLPCRWLPLSLHTSAPCLGALTSVLPAPAAPLPPPRVEGNALPRCPLSKRTPPKPPGNTHQMFMVPGGHPSSLVLHPGGKDPNSMCVSSKSSQCLVMARVLSTCWFTRGKEEKGQDFTGSHAIVPLLLSGQWKASPDNRPETV
jgi:hypothetical protein